MFSFKLNGREVTAASEMNLLTFLREQEELFSVKNGCAEGACGACMILVDGKAMRACIVKTSKVVGKEVTTLEGLSVREKEVFAYCFGKAGAVQCGFCIPGMVIAAKGLFYTTLTPTVKEIKQALKGNICRCTGYKKIEEAICLAAKMLKEETPVPKEVYTGHVGENLFRLDATKKTLGEAKYTDDLRFPDMVYGGALRTPHPRAKVVAIDLAPAKKHPDYIAAYTADAIPGSRYIGHLVKDWPVLVDIGETTRYVGDSVALVVAKTTQGLKEILGLIEVTYEVQNPITTPEEALQEGAPLIHAKGNLLKEEILQRGDVEKALAAAKYIVTHDYETPFTEHAFLEPECAVAMPEGIGVCVFTGGQSVYDEQHEIADMLGLGTENVHVISAYVGGGFGGKEDMSVQHHAALLAYLTKQTVKVILSRGESIKIHPKRHATKMRFTTACDEEGIITALKAEITADTGAYASLGGPVLQRACTHAAGPYNYQNISIIGQAVYTNNPPAGAFRGFGVTQSCFAMESNLNNLAKLIGISPWEIRYRNAIRPGQVLPNGQIADEGTALVETLEAVKEVFDQNPTAGIACAMKNAGVGVGIPDIGRVRIEVKQGKVHIFSSAACIGQGLATVLLQMFCETTGIAPALVIVEKPDTALTPNAGTTTASRQTVFSGEACKVAANKVKHALAGGSLTALEGQEFHGEYASHTDPMGASKENPVSHVAYGYATQVVILDEEGLVKEVVAAHDVGRAVNPLAIEGQIEGGVTMGLGYALTEDYPLKKGIPMAKFGTLGLLRATQVPTIRTMIIEKNKADLAYGAKGVGEIVTVPTAPAVQGAYFNLDGIFRTTLPLAQTAYRKEKK